MSPKFSKNQDYVIKDGKLVGKFEEMYKDQDDPWCQTTREKYASEKAVALNLLQRLKDDGVKNVVELGCGFGDFTARIHELGFNTTGLDISETAIEKAKERHLKLNDGSQYKLQFEVSSLQSFEKLKSLKPDVIVMPEITWYTLINKL
jgi:2-polyprenyl-3-methyl-5-hydroxy-6-metoxy-1,4-benzoquinol methylase